MATRHSDASAGADSPSGARGAWWVGRRPSACGQVAWVVQQVVDGNRVRVFVSFYPGPLVVADLQSLMRHSVVNVKFLASCAGSHGSSISEPKPPMRARPLNSTKSASLG